MTSLRLIHGFPLCEGEVEIFLEAESGARKILVKGRCLRCGAEEVLAEIDYSELVEIVRELLEFVDDWSLSVVERACSALGHPIADDYGCYCRKVRLEEGIRSERGD